MVDRCLVAAYDAGMRPCCCLTKADLARPRAVPRRRTPRSDVAVVITPRRDGAIAGAGRRAGRARRARRRVLVGHSGVGKSTLVNALVPGRGPGHVGVVNDVTGRGRHTSTSAVALRLPGGRGLGGRHPGRPLVRAGARRPARRARRLPRPRRRPARCPRGCTHARGAPGARSTSGSACGRRRDERRGQARLESCRRLLRAPARHARNRTIRGGPATSREVRAGRAAVACCARGRLRRRPAPRPRRRRRGRRADDVPVQRPGPAAWTPSPT